MRFLTDAILGDLILVRRLRIPPPPPPSQKVYARSVVSKPNRFGPFVIRLTLNIRLVILAAIFLFGVIGNVILDDVSRSAVVNTLREGVAATSYIEETLGVRCLI